MPHINSSILMSDANHFSNEQPINPYYHRLDLRKTSPDPGSTSANSGDIFSDGGDTVVSSTAEKWFLDGDSGSGAAGILCKSSQEPVDYGLAIQEHTAIYNLLIQSGIKVIKVPSPINCQDGVYVANWGLVRGNKAVLASLPNTRHNEQAYAEKVLTDLGKQVIHLPDGLKFSGQGDALACGNYLFCGSGYRSDPAAQAFVAETLDYDLVQLQTIPHRDSTGQAIINPSSGWADSFFYDIDLAIAIIKGPVGDQKGLIAYCPEAFTPASRDLLAKFDAVDKIEVSIDEAQTGFATNLVSTGEIVIMSAHAPNLSDELRRHGLTVLTTEITELAKGGGYIRCITLTLD